MAPRLGTRQRPLELFAAQLGVLGTTATPTDSTLAFLYPGLLQQDNKPRRRRVTQRSAAEPVASSSSSVLPTTRAASSEPYITLPDIYAPGADGLWRKTSGVAETCTMQPSSVSSSSTTQALDGTTSAASLEEFDTSTLPDGWKLQEPLARSSLIVIICLSVAVACAFVVLVLSLVSWRKRVHQDRDVERRRRKAKDIPPDDSLVVAAATQRKWLRAGMRWKENVRLSARRRRSARAVSSNDSVGSLRLSDMSRSRLSSSTVNLTSSAPSSRPSSPSHHPQSSSSSISSHPSTTIPNASETLQDPSSPSNAPSPSPTPRPPSPTTPAPPHPPLSPPPAHPPAYHPDERAPHYARDDGAPEPGPSKPRVPTTPRAHDPYPEERVWTPEDEDDFELSGGPPEVQTGHVATDDKALLAARAARASAPAPMHTRASISARAAAPELDDEMEMAEFASRRRSLGIGGVDEEIGEDVEASPSYVRHEPAVAFPEPPRRMTERASEKMRGEYAYAYGRGEGEGWAASAPPDTEMVASAPPPELELGPSALELVPSAPPEPSAPPGDDEFEHLPAPSAPPALDDEPAHVPLPPSPTDPRSP
ncbi:unnamed protein product [Peniophora sp. CBMAI 1063]|nr:unnamed protein product [Peniophora sp. CBMAI 1063]